MIIFISLCLSVLWPSAVLQRMKSSHTRFPLSTEAADICKPAISWWKPCLRPLWDALQVLTAVLDPASTISSMTCNCRSLL